MKVTYVGKHTGGVEIDLPEGTIAVAHEETVDVPAEIGRGLVESGTWKRATSKNQETD